MTPAENHFLDKHNSVRYSTKFGKNLPYVSMMPYPDVLAMLRLVLADSRLKEEFEKLSDKPASNQIQIPFPDL